VEPQDQPIANQVQLPQESLSPPGTPQKFNVPKPSKINRLKALLHNRKFILSSILSIGFIVSMAFLYFFMHQDFDSSSIFDRTADQLQVSNNLFDNAFVKLTIPDREPPFFTLTPQNQNRFGFVPTSKLVLTAREELPAGLMERITTASVPITIARASATTYEITPVSGLEKDEAFTVRVASKDIVRGEERFDRDYSWAFQTQGDFRVVSVIPGDKRSNVPVNTGIEIVFSQDDYVDPAPFISITPAFEYRLERHDETVVIIPLKPLSFETAYTVTLKKGLNLTSRDDPIDQDYVFNFQTESQAENQQKPYLSLQDTFIQVTPRDHAQVKTYSYNLGDMPINVSVFAAPSTTAFVESRAGHDKYLNSWMRYYAKTEPVNTSDWQKAFIADTTIVRQNQLEYLELPQALPEGKYLAEFRYGDNQIEYVWLQSSFISAYASVGRKQSLVWINSLDEATKIDLARVMVQGDDASFQAGADGVAVFTSPDRLFDKNPDYLQVINHDGRDIVLPTSNLSEQDGSSQKTANDYWSYLYQERKLYQQSDTVYFWGVIKDRDTNTAPASITLSLQSDTQTITPQSDGSFIGSFKLDNVAEGWYSLDAKVGEVVVVSSGFQVTSYTKPELKIAVSADKNALFAGESVEYSITASFYDGTPASNMELAVSTSHNSGNASITTDDQGFASFTYTSVYTSEDLFSYHHYPRYESIIVHPQRSQDSNVEGVGSVYVFGPRIGIEANNSQEDANARIAGEIYAINLDGINAGTTQETKGASVPNHKVHLTIEKSWWERVEEGTYYDYIEKTTQPQYRYIEHKETVTDQDLITNSDGQYNYDFVMEAQKSYYAKVSSADSDGRLTWSTDYFYYYPSSSQTSPTSDAQKAVKLTLNSQENVFSLGETVSFKVSYGNDPYPLNEKTKFLFQKANRGGQSYAITSSPQYEFQFSPSEIPNVTIGAMVFNGSRYDNVTSDCQWDWHCSYGYFYEDGFPFSGINVEYDQTDSQLELEIIPGKTSYKPGEEAQIEVTVKDDNQPLAGTSVQLVLVDQALEAIGGIRHPSILSSLYQFVPHDIYYRYFTHRPLFPDEPGAEMGGGGGDRDLFKDTPYFGTAFTDESGIARFSFTLSDDITTFIIYSQALTQDLKAGQQISYMPVTQDFFVTSNFARNLLMSDKAMIAASSFGEALSQNDQVQYEMIVNSPEGSEIQKRSLQGQAFKEVAFDIPALIPGVYSTIIRGQSDNHSDGLVYPLTVSDSRLNVRSAETYVLEASDSVSALKHPYDKSLPVSLTVTDAGKSKYFFDLLRVGSCDSNRLEKQIARSQAGKLMKTYFDMDVCDGDIQIAADFQTNTGGLSQVKWGGDNLETTVWASFVSPGTFNQEKLITYFQDILAKPDVGSVQHAYAAWGSTMLGKPELTRLYQLGTKASTFKERVIIALALADSGDIETARDMYLDILADLAYEKSPYIRIHDPNSDSDANAYILNTSYALLLGSLVNEQYSQGMHQYITDYEHQADDIVTDLSEITFIETELAKTPPEKTQISFSLYNDTTSQTLDYKSAWTRELRNQDMDNFKLTADNGKAEAVFQYTVPNADLGNYTSDDRLALSRTLAKTGGGGDIRPGDIVRITIHFDVVDDNLGPTGRYTITDHLPSGLDLITQPHLYGLKPTGNITKIRDNVVQASFYNSEWWRKGGNKSISYFARAVSPGTYTYEPTILQSNKDLSVMRFTNQDTITINEVE
jgi:alpha-2-macroglobulin